MVNIEIEELVRMELEKKKEVREQAKQIIKSRTDALNKSLFKGAEMLTLIFKNENVIIQYNGKQIIELDVKTIEFTKNIEIHVLDMLIIKNLDRNNIAYNKNNEHYQTVIKNSLWTILGL